MISLKIEGDKKSPSILFEPYSGHFVVKGRSNLENPKKYYDPVLNWLQKYSKDPAIRTTIRIELDYFNSASSKMLMKAFRILEPLHNKNHRKVKIQWCYHNSDGSMKEAGEDFKSMLDTEFELLDLEKEK